MIDLQVINDNVWVFLSHSHNDYDKVIQVRNMLEKRKFKPLMFFLKCLENDTEIDSLIKREIDCRYRFILCDSANAQASKWVQEEVRYIKEEKRRYCETVNLDTMTIDEVNAQLQKFEQRSSVTILYSNDRKNSLQSVIDDLLAFDMKVQVGKLEELVDGENPMETLIELTQSGFVVFLLGSSFPIDFVHEFIKVSDTVSKKVIILDENCRASLIDTILFRIDDYRELMDWSVRLYGDARIKLIEEAIYHGGPPTFQLLLASIYENGQYGVDVDLEKALDWLKAARYEDGLAVDNQIARIEEKLKKQGKRGYL